MGSHIRSSLMQSCSTVLTFDLLFWLLRSLQVYCPENDSWENKILFFKITESSLQSVTLLSGLIQDGGHTVAQAADFNKNRVWGNQMWFEETLLTQSANDSGSTTTNRSTFFQQEIKERRERSSGQQHTEMKQGETDMRQQLREEAYQRISDDSDSIHPSFAVSFAVSFPPSVLPVQR